MAEAANTSKVADRTKSSTLSTGVRTLDNDKQTPLHLAVRDRKEGVVSALLKEKIDKYAEDKDGKTALYYTVFEWKEEIARFFAADEETKGDLLLQAAGSGNAEAVNLLLGLGASPKVMGKDGKTPLYRAVFGGHVKAAKALKECIEDRDRDGDTILLKAVKLGNRKATALLLELKPTVDAKDAGDKTALYSAVCGGHRSIAELLVKGHASTEVLDENQDTLLHQAVKEGQEAAVPILLDFHAEIEAKDSNGKTPLENSIKKCITRILADNLKNADTELVQPGVNKEAQDNEGRTPLQKAVSNSHAETARFPVQPKANMEATIQGNTSLHQPARGGNPRVFNYCLPDEYYSIPIRSCAMAPQRSNDSTDNNWSYYYPAESYRLQDSAQPHGLTRHTTSTQATNQYPSYEPPRSWDHQRSTATPPTTPSEKGDR
jgi:ankyrin repeat protein